MCFHTYLGGVGLKEWHYSIHVYVLKSLACVRIFEFQWQTTQFCRALALQVLVECLSRNWWRFSLKVPTSLNWVRFRPGIWDGGATSSTEEGAWDRSPTYGCLGLAPMRGSKQCGIDILPIFLLRFGSNLWMCMASLASWVIWEESLSIILKFSIEGKGWWKSVQCLSMADVLNLECSFYLCFFEHSKLSTSAIVKHHTDFHHPLPSIENFSIIDRLLSDFHHPLPSIENFSIINKDSSQITQEAKEAIHIQRLDPNLKRNIGKMSIPHCFDPLIGAKPKHPHVGLLSQAPPSVDEVAPPSQIPGLNLTQFNEVGTFRLNLHQFLDRHLTRACLPLKFKNSNTGQAL